jgi:hypothetical protein
MQRKTTETVGPCGVPGPIFGNWPSTVRTTGVTDRAVSVAADCRIAMHDMQICRCKYGYIQQTWLGQSGVSEPRGQQFETAENSPCTCCEGAVSGTVAIGPFGKAAAVVHTGP